MENNPVSSGKIKMPFGLWIINAIGAAYGLFLLAMVVSGFGTLIYRLVVGGIGYTSLAYFLYPAVEAILLVIIILSLINLLRLKQWAKRAAIGLLALAGCFWGFMIIRFIYYGRINAAHGYVDPSDFISNSFLFVIFLVHPAYILYLLQPKIRNLFKSEVYKELPYSRKGLVIRFILAAIVGIFIIGFVINGQYSLSFFIPGGVYPPGNFVRSCEVDSDCALLYCGNCCHLDTSAAINEKFYLMWLGWHRNSTSCGRFIGSCYSDAPNRYAAVCENSQCTLKKAKVPE